MSLKNIKCLTFVPTGYAGLKLKENYSCSHSLFHTS